MTANSISEIDGENYHRHWDGELCRRDQPPLSSPCGRRLGYSAALGRQQEIPRRSGGIGGEGRGLGAIEKLGPEPRPSPHSVAPNAGRSRLVLWRSPPLQISLNETIFASKPHGYQCQGNPYFTPARLCSGQNEEHGYCPEQMARETGVSQEQAADQLDEVITSILKNCEEGPFCQSSRTLAVPPRYQRGDFALLTESPIRGAHGPR